MSFFTAVSTGDGAKRVGSCSQGLVSPLKGGWELCTEGDSLRKAQGRCRHGNTRAFEVIIS